MSSRKILEEMKRTVPQTFILLLSLFAVCFVACEKPAPVEEPENVPVSPVAHGVYVLSEGVKNMNNSNLSFYNFSTGKVSPDVFLAANSRGLGDTGNDLKAYGSKLYCVVNVSETVEIMDLQTAKSLKQISLSRMLPREITFYEGYAYVCCFSGDVVKIDTATMEVTATAQTGGLNPEGICVANGKLYVSNSGGLNYQHGYDNTVSVFDLATFTLMRKIPVVINPTRIDSDSQGDVYVVSNGNYEDVPMTLQRIDSQTDEVMQVFDFPVTNFAISGDLCYLYSFDWNTYEYAVKVLDVTTEQIVKEQFITDGTTFTIPYGIAVDPANGDVYLTEAYYNATNGDVLCFSADGRLRFKFEAGISPACLVFK